MIFRAPAELLWGCGVCPRPTALVTLHIIQDIFESGVPVHLMRVLVVKSLQAGPAGALPADALRCVGVLGVGMYISTPWDSVPVVVGVAAPQHRAIHQKCCSVASSGSGNVCVSGSLRANGIQAFEQRLRMQAYSERFAIARSFVPEQGHLALARRHHA